MKWLWQIIFCCVLFFYQTDSDSFAQEVPQDTLRNYPIETKSDLDTVISYQANRIEIDAKSRTTRLIGQAEVVYQTMRLQAGLITINWDASLLIAEALPDSLQPKSTESDSVKTGTLTGFPIAADGGQSLSGEKMFYNFKTRRARVIRGRAQYEEGYYYGDRIKKSAPNVYFVKSGIFSTCDLEKPHFHFASDKMKMIYRDKVIARPIIFYLHNIPVAALPFGVFPNRPGRHSGILVPRYGQSAVEGRYLRGLGYYWAPSQYWDTNLEVDFFEKTGFMFHNTTNYAIRYLMQGTISGSLLRKKYESGAITRRWDLMFNHSQNLSPTMSLSAYGSFVSDGSYYRDFSANRQQRLTREIRSNATLNKNWPDSRNSITINLSRSQYLDTDSWRETLPQISFRHGQEPLINLFRARKNETGVSNPSLAAKRWYESLYFSYSSQLLSNRAQTRNDRTEPFQKTTFFGIEHRIGLNSPFTLLRYFTLNQGLSYVEIWQDKIKEYFLAETTNRIESRDHFGFAARRTFNASLSINTKIFGTFPVNRWSIVAFRHVITPNVAVSYQPDFSNPVFGYYQQVQDSTGKVFKKDRFSNSQFGTTPSYAQRSINFSMRNLFQMKRLVGDKEVKSDLFTYDLYSSYNFEQDSLRLAPLNSSLRASPSRIFNITLSLTHSFYRFDPKFLREVNLFLATDDPWQPLRLTSLTLSSSLRLTNTLFHFGKKKSETKADSTAGELIEPFERGKALLDRFESTDEPIGTGEIPWTANFSFSYSERCYNPAIVQKSVWLNLTSDFRLTKSWRINYVARLDLKKKQIISQDFTIYRDLHCWEASFIWTPTGPYKRFYLRINIKSSLLQDIKLEKRGGMSTIFGY